MAKRNRRVNRRPIPKLKLRHLANTSELIDWIDEVFETPEDDA